MNDREAAEYLGVERAALRAWRQNNLVKGVDYQPPPKKNPGAGIKWELSGLQAAMKRFGEPDPVLLRIYRWCPNRRMVRVHEIGNVDRKGLLVLPAKVRARYGPRSGKMTVWGYKTADEGVYIWTQKK